nr:cell division FtsA domain-containing protein [Bacillus sp. REN10]
MIVEQEADQFHVVDMVMYEHKKRSMLDGQIQDIPSVAAIIAKIKAELEEKHGPLKKACVAAAGRALQTEIAQATIQVAGKPMTQEDVLHLELSAVQEAQIKTAKKQQLDQHHHYYCVGYSVLYYRLDGDEITSLIDQQGTEASVDIIATFLPRVVVESLISALARADLEIEALTLEPIAAIHVLVPPSMRRLNIALVDIGAGTSDIAITSEGTVISYGMVPIAGDEITEALSDHFLLDFPVAERVKRELQTEENITITDILGFETLFSKEEVLSHINGAVNRLAEAIQQEIIRLNNGNAPQAVMMVGGGSLTPGLPKLLAEKLQLPENRVAIRGTEAINELTMNEQITHAPTLVTPIGIAITSKQRPLQYKTVYVNDQPVRLFELNKLTAGDCLLAAGLKINQLYGKPGLAIMVTYNGQLLTIPGKYGNPPILTKNGQLCRFDEEVHHHDKLEIIKGEDGESASVQLNELLENSTSIQVTLHGETIEVPLSILVNGKETDVYISLSDGDIIEARYPSIAEWLPSQQKEAWIEELRPFSVIINDKKTYFPSLSAKIRVNGRDEKLSQPLQDGAILEWIPAPNRTVADIAALKQFPFEQSIIVFFNGKELTLTKEATRFYREGTLLQPEDVVYAGDELIVETDQAQGFIFQDLFRHVDISIPEQEGKTFRILRNNEETTFYEAIFPGDQLEIKWETIKK